MWLVILQRNTRENCTAVGITRHDWRLCRRPTFVAAGAPGAPLVVPVVLTEVDQLSSVRIYIPRDLRQPEARAVVVKVRMAAAGRFVACCYGVGM